MMYHGQGITAYDSRPKFVHVVMELYLFSLLLFLWMTVPSIIKAPLLIKVVSPSTAIVHLYPVSSSWQHAPVSHYYVIVVPASWQLSPADLVLEQV